MGGSGEHGCKCVDRHIVADYLDIRGQLPPADYRHYAPECTSTTKLAQHKHKRTEANGFLGKETKASLEFNDVVSEMVAEIRAELRRNDRFAFTIEQPVSGNVTKIPMFKSISEMPGVHCATITMCKFGVKYLKPTYIWTNVKPLFDALEDCKCSADYPCANYNNHEEVRGNTTACTPYPEELCAMIKRYVTRHVATRRFEPFWRPRDEKDNDATAPFVCPSGLCVRCELE